MNRRRRRLELLVLGACAFVMTQAILALVLDPGDTPADGNPVWKLILALCYLSVAVVLVMYYRKSLFVLRRNWPLVALIFLALASFSWAASPALVLQRSIAVLGTTLLGIAFAVCLSLEDQLELLSWVFRIIAVLSLACVLLLPSVGISQAMGSQGDWRGIFGHKNGLGSIMALSIMVEWQLPAHTRFSRLVKALALGLSAVLLFFSGSITSMVAVFVSILFIEIYRFATKRLRVPPYAVIFGILLLIVSFQTAVHFAPDGMTGTLGRSSDLTGRTEIWSLVINFIGQRPILGYGYSGFWAGASPESAVVDEIMDQVISYSHNGFLEILLTLGAVGLLFTLCILGAGIKRAYHYSKHDRGGMEVWPLAFLLFFLLHNITECTILLQELEWAMCVAIVVGADPALFLVDEAQEEEFLLVPSEEMI